MARFYVGQPVVCVDGKIKPMVDRMWPGLNWPVHGKRYVVRGYVNVISGWPGVLVREITNRRIRYLGGSVAEASFSELRFAPITDEQVRSIIEEAVKPPQTVRKMEEVE